ncbi:MAG: D-tyrosyl-tRNA(Tyr) deacylase [Lactobacillales bacterium]|nr:D-tyrosyl-tRNA(Tyr) deacylase [Lactobacillales bacterium]
MKVLVQRSLNSSVSVDNKIVGKIDNGLVLLVGFTYADTIEDIKYLVKKVINLRIFDDENGIMNKSIIDVGGSILSISQFTLYADTKKGNRPSYINALNGEEATKLYDLFNEELRNNDIKVETGIFGSDMKVSIINDGPVTIILESRNKNEK